MSSVGKRKINLKISWRESSLHSLFKLLIVIIRKQKIRDELEEKLRAVQENEQRLQEKKRRADEVREQRERVIIVDRILLTMYLAKYRRDRDFKPENSG